MDHILKVHLPEFIKIRHRVLTKEGRKCTLKEYQEMNKYLFPDIDSFGEGVHNGNQYYYIKASGKETTKHTMCRLRKILLHDFPLELIPQK